MLSCASVGKRGGPNDQSAIRSRRLLFESLENREMLSVSTAEFAAIHAQYANLNLTATMTDYNVIEITAAQLSAQALQTAVQAAAQTTQDDLIVVRTDDNHSLVKLDATLTINIDSARFGSLAIVALGTERLQLQSDAASGVIHINNGSVALGGIVLVGVENAAMESVSVFDLLQNASTAAVQTSGIIRVTENTNRAGNYSLFSETVVGPQSTSGGSPIGSKSYSITVGVGGTLEAYLTGLTEAEKNAIIGGSTAFLASLNPFDAEKTASGDSQHCWAGTAANMLAYSGWGEVNGFQTEDDILHYFTANFTDVGSRAYYGNDWFLTGHYAALGASGWAQPKTAGSGGFYPGYTIESVAGEMNASSAYDLTMALDRLKVGAAVGLSLGWYNSAHERTGGHAITLWGAVYDTARSPYSNDYYVSLLVTDSDDNYGSGESAPNTLKSLDIAWSSAYTAYRFTTYYSSSNGYLEDYNWLTQYTAASPSPPKAELRPYHYWNEWTKPMIVTTGTVSSSSADDATVITTANNVYVYFAVLNDGNIATPSSFTSTLTLTGGDLISPIVRTTTRSAGLSPRYSYSDNVNFGTLAAGEYRVTLTLDSGNTIDEYDETDNTYGTSFVVVAVGTPATPSNFRAASGNSESVTLAWDTVNDATGYEIRYKSSVDSEWTTVDVPGQATATKTIASLTANTSYNFQIRARNGYGSSPWSSIVSLEIEPGDTISTAVTVAFIGDTFVVTEKIGSGLYGTKDVDMYGFTVSATDVGKTFTFGTALPPGGSSVDTYIRLFNASGSQLSSNDDGGSSLYSYLTYQFTTAGTYFLGVSSYGNRNYDPNVAGSGPGGTTGDYTLTITRPATTPPDAPVVTVTNQVGSVKLNWGTVDGADKYEILRQNSDGSWTSLAHTTALQYIDTAATPNVAMSYIVRACAGALVSGFTIVYGKALPNLGVPQVAVTNQPGSVKLTWSLIAGADKYEILRQNSDGSWTSLAYTTALQHIDTNATPNVATSYIVRACAGTAVSGFTIVYGKALPNLAAPVVTVTNQTGSVKLNWGAIAGADKYEILRQNSDGSWASLAYTTALQHVDTTATPNIATSYIVRACAGTSVSGFNIVYGRALPNLGIPQVAVTNQAGSVKLNWGAVAGADKYEILRQNSDGSWTSLAYTTTLQYIDMAATPNVATSYIVRACAGTSVSGFTIVYGKALPNLGVPQVAVTNQAGSVKLNWGAVAGADKYEILRQNSDGSWTSLAYTMTLQYIDMAVTPNVATSYIVRSCAGTSVSGFTIVYGKALPNLAAPVVTVTNQTGSVKLNWGAVAGADKYEILRQNSDGSWTSLAYTTTLQYIDMAATPNVATSYIVRACAGTSVSGFDIVYGRALPNLGIPQVAVTNQPGSVKLTWSVIAGADRYEILRQNSDGSWASLAYTTALQYIDATATPNVVMSYIVRSCAGTAVSGFVIVYGKALLTTPSEPGDTLATAMVVSFVGNTFTTTQKIGDGSYGARDVDMYAITVSVGDVGKVFTFGTALPPGGTAIDTYIRLFNASGTLLDYNDDGGSGYYSQLEWTPTAAGTYYIGVSVWPNTYYNPNVAGSGQDAYTTGDYTLTITCSAGREAPSLVVTTLSDTVNAFDGLISLREAISYAGTSGLGTTISFASSLYGQTITLGGSELYLDKNLVINGVGSNITINANGQSMAFEVCCGANVTLTGLAIINGRAEEYWCSIAEDYLYYGGAIYVYGSGTALTVANCTISGTSYFNGNNTPGIYNEYGTVTVTNSTISNNSGCGIYNDEGVITVTNSTISGNFSDHIGGGIYNEYGTVTLTNSTIAGNFAASYGGGILNSDTMIVTNCTITGNVSYYDGGGIENWGTMKVINSLIAENSAYYGSGGGIDNWYGTMALTNCTVAGNSAYYGGGISNYGADLTINNTIVAKNSAPYYVDIDDSSGMISGGYNLIGSDTGHSLTNGVNGNIIGGDPLFVNIAQGNYRLAAGSSALNKGNNALAVDAAGWLLTTDLDGNARIVNGTVDMGAYEYGLSASSAPQVTGTNQPGSGPTLLSGTAPASFFSLGEAEIDELFLLPIA